MRIVSASIRNLRAEAHLPLSLAFGLIAVTAVMLLSSDSLAQKPQNAMEPVTVFTMGGEYEIRSQGDGKNFLLRRLAKDGSAYETIPVTKISEKNGEVVYSDVSGKRYTTLPDGRLQEKVRFDTPPVRQRPGPGQTPEPALQLMTSPPVLPHTRALVPPLVYRFKLPMGELPLRTEMGLLLLTTGMDEDHRRREVAVQKVADQWYVRTSITADPEQAAAFRVDQDGTVNGYNQLAAGVPQVAAIHRGGVPASVPSTPRPTSAVPQSAGPAVNAADVMLSARFVEYEGRRGRLVGDAAATHNALYVDGQLNAIAVLIRAHGNPNLFTVVGRDDISVFVDPQGKLIVTDSHGQPAHLENLAAASTPESSSPPVNFAPSASPENTRLPPIVPPAAQESASVAATEKPESVPEPGASAMEYRGHKGNLITRSDQAGRHLYLLLDGDAAEIELQRVRGSARLFTVVGRDDVLVVMDGAGKITAMDSHNQPVDLRVGGVPSAVPVERTAVPQSVTPADGGRTSGTLTCDGSPIPQNAERVFTGLPPTKLELSYDRNTWDLSVVGNGPTQKIVIKNKKAGVQRKCSIQWKVAP